MKGKTTASNRAGRTGGGHASAALERRVLHYVRARAALRPGEHALAAVSGGPDSTALLLILSRLAPALNLTLTAAHFDHGLRGKTAAHRERSYVEGLCQRLGVPLRAGTGDTRAHARSYHLSREEAARELRYTFLGESALAAGCTVVATGHTADDQVETVLLHIIRGSGLAGLAGMAARGPWPLAGQEGMDVARPLLSLRRRETVGYCQSEGAEPVVDPSNVSPAYLRNRVRLELLPLLRRYNPRIDSALLRLAEAAGADLAVLPAALRRHALRLAVRRLVGDLRDLHADHVDALLAGLERGVGYHLDLPRNLSFEVGYEEATLSLGQPSRAAPVTSSEPLPPEAPLAVPGVSAWGRWVVEAELAAVAPAETAPRDPWQAWLDAGVTGEDLTVRSWRPGDRFQPLGLSGEKKLQDFFVDARVARAERVLVPLVCGRPGIVWVVGHRIDHRARVTEATHRLLRLRFRDRRLSP